MYQICTRHDSYSKYCVPVDVVGSCSWKFVVQYMAYRHCIQTSRTGICSAQHEAFTALEAGVLVLPLIHRHIAVQRNRLYVATVQEHADPIASAIVVVKNNYLLLVGYFRFDIFQEFGRFVVWSYSYKFLRYENMM